MLAIRELGPDAVFAIDGLTRIMNQTNHPVASNLATLALSFSDRPEALPPLMNAITNLHAPDLRYSAIDGVGIMGTNALPAVPLLFSCTKDPDRRVAERAAFVLGRLKLEPGLVVPALISNAVTNRSASCVTILFALGQYGTNAQPAVPLLLKALHDQDENVRSAATNALHSVAPNLLTRASFSPHY